MIPARQAGPVDPDERGERAPAGLSAQAPELRTGLCRADEAGNVGEPLDPAPGRFWQVAVISVPVVLVAKFGDLTQILPLGTTIASP